AAPFIAADVGGTHVRIGLVAGAGAVEPLHYRKYACADFPGLAEIIEDFLGGLPLQQPVRHGVIACAGHPRADGSLITVNLPWPVSPDDIRARLGFEDFRLVNDFAAVAHAVDQARPDALLHPSGPVDAQPGPTLVLGPGTALGAAVRIPAGNGAVVLATEAGQAALTTGNELE